MASINTKDELLAVALYLGARKVCGWTPAEEKLVKKLPRVSIPTLSELKNSILRGSDPLGEAFCRLNSSEDRRPMGAVYTPLPIVRAMLKWTKGKVQPQRIIDPGTGSARFLVSAGRVFKDANLLGIEKDPFAAILARGHLAAAGFEKRSMITVGDFRNANIKKIHGETLYLGNPPYVRHHLIEPKWKNWLIKKAAKHGHSASALAGLHVHFFLATAEFARTNDVGVFITAAEWLDVNYGSLVRDLFLGDLGGSDLQVIEPAALPFPGTATTGVITGFKIGSAPKLIGIKRVESLQDLGSLKSDRKVNRARFDEAKRWTPLTRAATDKPSEFVELGEICRVHRGTVTGANKIWIAGEHSSYLPETVLYASVTKARELFRTNGILGDASNLRNVIDIPIELDQLSANDRKLIDRFLRYAKAQGGDLGYIARTRRAWWSVGLRTAAPILATYMARRPPAFVRNLADARHINIAHGLYPREAIEATSLKILAEFLSKSVSLAEGRTYAGGLTKFEPREMERLLVPKLEILNQNPTVLELLQ